MKNLILLLLSFNFVHAQMAIGKNEISSPDVSLEFSDTENRGILLPWVISHSSVLNAVDGTFIYDTSDQSIKHMKNGNWFDLSKHNNGKVDSSLQDNETERIEAKVVIGNNAVSDSTPGILVLSDSDKAMVLPKVENPHENIINPAPGTMVYDTTNKLLAVFNGTVWTFWKPSDN